MSEAEPRPPAAARSEVGVVGLGHIGGAIAANLGEDGLAPLVFDAVADRAHAVPGAQAVDSVAAVGAGAAITLTSLPTPEVVDAVAREWATAALSSVHVDVAFLGTNGLTVRRGLTTPDQQEAAAKRAMVTSARRAVVLADASKVGVDHFCRFADLADIDTVVTDSSLDAETVSEIDAAGPEVICA